MIYLQLQKNEKRHLNFITICYLSVIQYATGVKDLIIKNLSLRFLGENSVEHIQSCIRIPVWSETRDS